MAIIEGTVFCDNCGIEITWAPIVSAGQHYCCQDCHDHLRCDCGPVLDWDDEGRSGTRTNLIEL